MENEIRDNSTLLPNQPRRKKVNQKSKVQPSFCCGMCARLYYIDGWTYSLILSTTTNKRETIIQDTPLYTLLYDEMDYITVK